MANTIATNETAARTKDHLRLCAVSRVQLPPDQLVRFVSNPDGIIVPDLAGKLPGRGVWVGAKRTQIDEAVRTRAFARSLKQGVKAPADLSELVEKLMEKRSADALALANKAGQVISGFEKVSALISKGRALAIVNAADGADDGREKIERKFAAASKARNCDVNAFRCLTIRQMSLALGRSNVVHAALTPGGAAQRFVAEAWRLTRYRLGPGQEAMGVDNAISRSGTENA